jgi:hypothetical protein
VTSRLSPISPGSLWPREAGRMSSNAVYLPRRREVPLSLLSSHAFLLDDFYAVHYRPPPSQFQAWLHDDNACVHHSYSTYLSFRCSHQPPAAHQYQPSKNDCISGELSTVNIPARRKRQLRCSNYLHAYMSTTVHAIKSTLLAKIEMICREPPQSVEIRSEYHTLTS